MFATFDKKEMPIIHVTLGENIENNEDFNMFCDSWNKCDDIKKPYTFIFDSNSVGLVHIKYAYKMSCFISDLKARKRKLDNIFLEKSIIICNNWYALSLLRLIFSIQKPVAPVYIVETMDKAKDLYLNLCISPDLYDSSISFFPSEN